MGLPPLSVLELSVLGHGQTSSDALDATTEFARAADRLGYRRLWVAEHHNMAAVASTAPAVLLAHLGAHTQRIRLGSGGVMLPNHAPLVVAEQFAMLEALHPGRIDIGLGRAPGSDMRTAEALRRSHQSGAEPEFAHDIQLVEALVAARGVDGAALSATPAPTSVPEIWVLGSSLSSAVVASALGLPYAFAHHFSAENTLAAAALYRDRFQPGPNLSEPRILITTEALLADSDAEAERRYLPAALSYLQLRRNVRAPMPTQQQAENYPWTDLERGFVADRMATAAIGSPQTAVQKLAELAVETTADELMVLTRPFCTAHRIESLELLAESALVKSS
jgi:luciferase family oxidoreductase group 1